MTEIGNHFLVSAPLLLVLLTVATCDDLLEQRIPNAVVMWGIVLALAIGGISNGYSGILSALGGLMIGGMLLLPFYVLGGMGAGDVKLMAMAGAFLGPAMTLLAVAFTLVSGFALAVSILGIWIIRQSDFGLTAVSAMRRHLPARLQPSDPGDRPTHFPYAAAIAVGSTVALWWPAIGISLGTGG